MLFERNIQLIDWKGIGYIVLDPRSGAGAYMISGGFSGGHSVNKSEEDKINIRIGSCSI